MDGHSPREVRKIPSVSSFPDATPPEEPPATRSCSKASVGIYPGHFDLIYRGGSGAKFIKCMFLSGERLCRLLSGQDRSGYLGLSPETPLLILQKHQGLHPRLLRGRLLKHIGVAAVVAAHEIGGVRFPGTGRSQCHWPLT